MKKTVARILAALLAAVMLVSLVSCGSKTYEEDGFSITLNGFVRQELEGYVATYGKIGGDYAVLVSNEDHVTYEALGYGIMSPREYAEYFVETNELDSEIVEQDGQVTFEYTASGDKKEYNYLVYIFSGKDAYWVVQFAALLKDFEGLRPQMEADAATIVVE